MAKKQEKPAYKCQNCGKPLKWYKFPVCKACVRLLNKKLWG